MQGKVAEEGNCEFMIILYSLAVVGLLSCFALTVRGMIRLNGMADALAAQALKEANAQKTGNVK